MYKIDSKAIRPTLKIKPLPPAEPLEEKAFVFDHTKALGEGYGGWYVLYFSRHDKRFALCAPNIAPGILNPLIEQTRRQTQFSHDGRVYTVYEHDLSVFEANQYEVEYYDS